MRYTSWGEFMTLDQTVISSIDAVKESERGEPYFVILAGAHIGRLYNLSLGEHIGGRSPDCQLWIEDNTISRKHFKVLVDEKQCRIFDMNSTNGTYVNSKRIETCTLQPGDKIQISRDTIIQFDYFDEDRKISEQKRYEMGVKDPVTNSFNKSYFLQRISDEFSFSYRQNQPLSLLIFDIDYFKMINDNYGHLAGDKVLQDISLLVQNTIRLDDVFCRYGGEEFVIIMRNTDCQSAVNLGERLRKAIQNTPVFYDDMTIHVTVSMGVATLKDKNFRDFVALTAEADRLLYKSKGAGRNCLSAPCQPVNE